MLTRRVLNLKPFGVMEILAKAREMERRGEQIIHLEIGEPDFPTPQAVVEAGIRAMCSGDTHYTEAQGLYELREKIAGIYNYADVGVENVIITGGVSQALNYIISSLVESGREAIIFEPTYPCYSAMIEFYSGRVIRLGLKEDFSPDLDALQEAISSRTSMILINTPNNPTGSYLSLSELRAITEIAQDYGCYVVSDEIYSKLVYDRDRAPSILETGYEKSIVLDGFSKAYAMTGWRLGYLIAPEEIAKIVTRLQQNFFISPSSFAQRAALVAIELREELKEIKKAFNRRRQIVCREVKNTPELEMVEPKGAFYAFPRYSFSMSSVELCSYLLKRAKVALTPGVGFGRAGEGHIRLSYAASEEDLILAFERLREAFSEL